MRSTAVCIAFVLTYTSGSFVAGLRYIDPQAGSNGDISDKRLDLTEPSCDELRAMWRYTKRQSRATKTGNGYPMYGNGYPFNPNIWPRNAMFTDRIKLSRGYTRDIVAPTRLKLREELEGRHAGRPRSRAAGGAPIYGRMVHKAPAGTRWRNAMRGPLRPKFGESYAQYFGKVNTGPYLPNKQRTNFRVGGGISSQVPPQYGSFEELRNLVQAERAHELQEQHRADEMEAKVTAFRDAKDQINEEQLLNRQQWRKQFSNPIPIEKTPKVNYDYNQRRYNNLPITNIGQAWSRSGPLSREYMLP
ncbi:PREDICTED: uncharacterized protein LOC105452229 isoform X2 [Wasmannia auropunctata]|nr:PREDICTED: uncharacterized protein LOC105452229 isoform X2 [Wasmannia auropunctata]XP_011691476.1 PREDICTED: uncharacterized protein LOC105452229 isoform X2 [Wasmannia auropunctata]